MSTKSFPGVFPSVEHMQRSQTGYFNVHMDGPTRVYAQICTNSSI